ncbi:hypothetical protein BO71DRAFT_230670 [Aspergillus ellipticus CBS 707.79]|uniref:Malonyl-CoA:ACP transacylase (MAT) domain-containing protein n=1 Tax=Aspergillus ellipticus CBS 707.79 TaxID=1448320 RepID=A0A319E1D7_9EURO|nr:hypothetical protein BO71DRAFT_230670 [Aspergillus ellipticus CBS 707.79]
MPAQDEPLMYSTVTWERIKAEALGPECWVRNMVQRVEFLAGMNSLLSDLPHTASHLLVEIGPHSALQGPLRQIIDAHPISDPPPYSSLLTRPKDALRTFLEAAGCLSQHGCELDLAVVNNQVPQDISRLVDFPPYAWNHTEESGVINRWWYGWSNPVCAECHDCVRWIPVGEGVLLHRHQRCLL